MQKKQKLINTAALIVCSGVNIHAHATLPSNAILQMDPPVLGGYYGNVVVSGCYFGMDNNGNSTIAKNERVGLFQNSGLAIGKSQTASGTHAGSPNGTELPGVDKAWNFFGNTGLHKTTSNVNIISDDGGQNVTLDLSGWTVSWNSIDTIPMDAGAWESGFTNGVAKLTCAVDCSLGDSYILDYSATVPDGDPSGFGGVQYHLHLEGTIATFSAPTTSSSGGFSPGTIATTVGSTDGYISLDELIDNGGVVDDQDVGSDGEPIIYNYTSGLTDFSVSGAGATEQIAITLLNTIPADAIYRKFSNGTWRTFVSDGTNLIASAPTTGTYQCPTAGSSAYNHSNGLVEGDGCIQLTIANDGIYDDDPAAGNIADPGGVTSGTINEFVDNRTSGTDGCSMTKTHSNANDHADWWILSIFVGLLGWLNIKNRKNS